MLTQIGEYRVVRLLGEGGMGAVHLGQERLSGRSVALKLLHEHVASSSKAREMFLREMAIVARLDHPNVVRSLASLEHEGRLVLVLEYLEGTTLRAELSERGPVPWQRVIGWTQQLCAALGAAHGQSPPVVHRDLKPENVMLLPDGQLKVMDFGIARAASDARTGTTRAVGTLTYMSPEQIDAQGVDARSDLYSLGVLLYELLTGHAPYRQQSPRQLLNAICTEPPLPLPQALRAELPPAFAGLLAALLQKRPEQRPASVDDVVAQLESIRTGSQAPPLLPSGRPPPPPEDLAVAPDQAPTTESPVAAVQLRPAPAESSRGRALLVMGAVAVVVGGAGIVVASQLLPSAGVVASVPGEQPAVGEPSSETVATAAPVQQAAATPVAGGTVVSAAAQEPVQPEPGRPRQATVEVAQAEAQSVKTVEADKPDKPSRVKSADAPASTKTRAPRPPVAAKVDSAEGNEPAAGRPSGPILSRSEAQEKMTPLVRKCLEQHKHYMVETHVGQGDAKDTGPIPRVSIVDKYSSVLDWREVDKLGTTPVGRCINRVVAPFTVRAFNVHFISLDIFNDLEPDPLAGLARRLDQKAAREKIQARDELARRCNERFVDSSKPGTQFGVLFKVRGIDGAVTSLNATPIQDGKTPWGKCIVDAYKGLSFERFRSVRDSIGYYLQM